MIKMIFFFPNFSTMKNTRQRKGCKKTIARLPNTRNQHSWPVLIIPPARYVYSHRRTRDHANASRVILIPEHRWQAVQCVSGRCFVSSLYPPSSWSLARIRITNSPSEKTFPRNFLLIGFLSGDETNEVRSKRRKISFHRGAVKNFKRDLLHRRFIFDFWRNFWRTRRKFVSIHHD